MGRHKKNKRKPWEGFWNKGSQPLVHTGTADEVARGVCNPADPSDPHYDASWEEDVWITGGAGSSVGSSYGGNYSYDWDRPVGSLGFKNKDEKRDTTAWDNWEKTGEWKGYSYHYAPSLDYRYIEQMANLFSLKYDIRTRLGSTLGIDLENKILTYNPTQFMFGTKAELIASLLHEIGHLRHSTTRKKLTSKYLKKYKNPAFELINAFEDFRVDTLMRHSYEGAEDIYDAAKPAIKEMAQKYAKMGVVMQKLQIEFVKVHLNNILNSFGMNSTGPMAQEREKKLEEMFGEKDFGKLVVKLSEMQKRAENAVTFFAYLGAIILTGYGEVPLNMPPQIEDYVNKTKHAIAPCETAPTMQAVCDTLDAEVFPIIEDLLKELIEGSKEFKETFGDAMAAAAMEWAQGEMGKQAEMQGRKEALQKGYAWGYDQNRAAQDSAERFNPLGDERDMGARSFGPSEGEIPSSWAKGDYKPLKASVESAIKLLINKLTFLRRQEATVRYQQQQRRGKLNTRSLYRHPTGSQRLFKKILPNTDTLSSFAFSIMVDTSGSMAGNAMVHATRGLVLLSEVFTKMGIPFEIQHFDDNFRTIKKFDDDVDDNKKRTIGGMARANGGGTNFFKVFGAHDKEILARPEKNKFVLMLSDGGVGGGYDFERGFQEWANHNVKIVGIGLDCGDEVVRLCGGNGVATDEAQMLPDLFAGLLKKLILKR